MKRVPKKTLDIFEQYVIGGKEYRFDDIKQDFFPGDKDAAKLATTMVHRLRRRLRDQKPPKYFYCISEEVGENGETHILSFRKNKGFYRLLTTSDEYSHITDMLWRVTDGFRRSCEEVLKDGIDKYPNTLRPALIEFNAGMSLISGLAIGMTNKLSGAIKSLNTGEQNEPSNK